MLKFSAFKRRDNDRYNYTPRYYKGKKVSNVYEIDNKFSRYKEITNENDLGAQWKEARKLARVRGNKEFNVRVLIIAGVLLLIFLWIIDFDLSIFKL